EGRAFRQEPLEVFLVVGRRAGEAQEGPGGGVPRARRPLGGAVRRLREPRGGQGVQRRRGGARAGRPAGDRRARVLPGGRDRLRGREREGRGPRAGQGVLQRRRARRDARRAQGRRAPPAGGGGRDPQDRPGRRQGRGGVGGGLGIRFDCGTRFREGFAGVGEHGITRRAREGGLWSLALWNPRDFTTDNYRTVDDRPYGGGPGMVMLAEPLAKAIAAAKAAAEGAAKVVYLAPQGATVGHEKVMELAAEKRIVRLCGRYEGVDERLIESAVDEELSIGDYVLSGGELAAMVLIDAVVRQLPGALGDEGSAEKESFVNGLLDCPQY